MMLKMDIPPGQQIRRFPSMSGYFWHISMLSRVSKEAFRMIEISNFLIWVMGKNSMKN
jgi:hypothetical protein